MEFSYKFRLYPNDVQSQQINKTFGCCRFVWNYYLAKRKESYEQERKVLNYYDCARDLTQLKKTTGWLVEVDSTALQSSILDLDAAYQNFFRRVKRGDKPGYPQLKSKKMHHQSYKSRSNGKNIKVLDEGHIQLPKLGAVRCAISKQVQGHILSATVSRTYSGKYFVALCCREVKIPALPKTGAVIGVDLGIRNFITTSDGTKRPSNQYAHKTEKKLRRLQRSLSRKATDSKNHEKARIKLALLQEKITNKRKDNLHKLTTELVRNYDVICIEDLDVRDMMQKRWFAKLLADASFGEFRRLLEYKAAWYEKSISVIDKFYPSNQICSCCGNRNPEAAEMSRQRWTCSNCGTTHDRSTNAAINILHEGLRLLA